MWRFPDGLITTQAELYPEAHLEAVYLTEELGARCCSNWEGLGRRTGDRGGTVVRSTRTLYGDQLQVLK